MHIKKGDKVKILSGKDRGKSGKVIRVMKKTNRAVVEGLNSYIRHQRPRKQGEKGQKMPVAMPVHISNLQVVDNSDKKPTRTRKEVNEKGFKQRVSVKTGKVVD